MNLSMAVEQTTLPFRSASHTTGLIRPTDARYNPGRVVIIGSHCGNGHMGINDQKHKHTEKFNHHQQSYLIKLPLTVLLGLRNMEYLIHVRISLFPRDFREQKAGYEKVNAAQSCEDINLKFLHPYSNKHKNTRSLIIHLWK